MSDKSKRQPIKLTPNELQVERLKIWYVRLLEKAAKQPITTKLDPNMLGGL